MNEREVLTYEHGGSRFFYTPDSPLGQTLGQLQQALAELERRKKLHAQREAQLIEARAVLKALTWDDALEAYQAAVDRVRTLEAYWSRWGKLDWLANEAKTIEAKLSMTLAGVQRRIDSILALQDPDARPGNYSINERVAKTKQELAELEAYTGYNQGLRGDLVWLVGKEENERER